MSTPTLDDDRIDAMRLAITYRIDRDELLRRRRARRATGLVAAAVLVVGGGGYALQSAAPGDDSEGGVADSQAARSAPAAVPEDGGGAAGDAASGSGRRTALDDRQVVTTGQVTVTVDDPRRTAQSLSTFVEGIGGRVDSRAENGTGRDASASVTVRVPSDRVTATIERLGTYGTVVDVSLQNEDVTAQTTDLDARIDALRVSVARLTRLLAEAGTSAELVRAEGALTERQEQLESLQAERKRLADQVSLSTLSIELAPDQRVESVEPGGFTGGLRDGWNGLVSTVNRGVEVVGVVLPWAVVALLLGGGVRLVARRRR